MKIATWHKYLKIFKINIHLKEVNTNWESISKSRKYEKTRKRHENSNVSNSELTISVLSPTRERSEINNFIFFMIRNGQRFLLSSSEDAVAWLCGCSAGSAPKQRGLARCACCERGRIRGKSERKPLTMSFSYNLHYLVLKLGNSELKQLIVLLSHKRVTLASNVSTFVQEWMPFF